MFTAKPLQKEPALYVWVAVFAFLCPTAQALVQSVGADGINAHSVHQQGITGKGIRIGMLSSGNARASHEAFLDADGKIGVVNHDFSGAGVAATSHDTQVAAIAVSRGGTDCPLCKGAAPGAALYSARISDGSIRASVIERGLNDLIVNRGCRVIVTGIQLSSQSARPDGHSLWARLYDYYAERYDVVFANAAGNSESAVTIFGDGCNGITTGGLALDEAGKWRVTGSISNPGPTLDGRRKPELMAPAHRLMLPAATADAAWAAAGSPRGETSYAAPHTAGAAALLMERAAQTETPFDDKSLTLKAVLINTADPNLLGKDGLLTAPDENVWHPHRGYGRLDTGRAMRLLEAGQILPDTPVTAPAGWAYRTILAEQRDIYTLNGRKGDTLIVTLTWHRRLLRTGTLHFIDEYPQLNLALEIRSPDETALCGEKDDNNNLRKVSLKLTKDGMYSVIVQNTTDQDNRDYAIAFERISPRPSIDQKPAPHPNSAEPLDPAQ